VLLLGELLSPPEECGIEVDERSVEVKEGKSLHDADLSLTGKPQNRPAAGAANARIGPLGATRPSVERYLPI
jgi:hypothetical protein